MAMIGTYAPSLYQQPMRRVGLAPVTVYGTTWCAASQMVRRHLDRLGVPAEAVSADSKQAAIIMNRMADPSTFSAGSY